MLAWFPSWEEIRAILIAFGLVKGMFVIFFFMSQAWIYTMYAGRLKDRQSEINRLADDNRQYRERFLALLDKKFNYSPPKAPKRTRKK